MTEHDPKNVSPDQLVSGFSKSPILKCLVFALVFHVVLLGATSVGMILEWTGVKSADDPAQADEAKVAKGDPATRPAPTTRRAAASADPRKNTPVYRDLTATRPAPKNPDDDPGTTIPFDVTNP